MFYGFPRILGGTLFWGEAEAPVSTTTTSFFPVPCLKRGPSLLFVTDKQGSRGTSSPASTYRTHTVVGTYYFMPKGGGANANILMVRSITLRFLTKTEFSWDLKLLVLRIAL